MTEPSFEFGPRGSVKPSRSVHWPIKADRWNPWRALALDYPEVRVQVRALPGRTMGFLLGKTIYLNEAADDIDRTDTLAHELIHYERQIFHRDPELRQLEERTVEELAARRLIPFKDLCRVLLQSPNSNLGWWAWHLRVGVPLLEARLITLTPVERAALQEVRGGPLPAPADGTYWDAPLCGVDLQTIATRLQTDA